MKILLTRSMLPEDISYIEDGLNREICGQYELVVPQLFDENSICELSESADVLLGPFITKRIVEKAKKLKLIQVPWTGMDTFDFSAVRGTNIPVCNTHTNADCVAELGITILLDLLKKASYHDRKMRFGNWNRDQKPLTLKSRMLSKQNVCILGFGNIGSSIGKLVSAFGATVMAVDDNAKVGIAKEVYSNVKIKAALAKADVVICTLPLTTETRAFINADMFNAMKTGTIFINMARAAIVDEDAVWDALKTGKLSAFGSDVWWNAPKRGESESYPSQKHEFWKLDNVLLSPHRAGYVEGSLPHLDGAIDNIIALSKGRPLKCVVDTCKGF